MGVANRRYRAIGRARELRARLGGSPNLLDPFPSRPARMHRLTYNRLLDKAIAAQERVIALDLCWLRTRNRTRGDDLVGTLARLSLWADRIMDPDGIREGPRVEGEPGRT